MIIQEFLANPTGADKEGEYILLFNDATVSVPLSGWNVADASGKAFKLSGVIEAGDSLKLTAAETKISLNNSGETVSLFDASGALIDSLSYSGAATEDVPVSRELTAEVRGRLFDDLPGKFLPGDASTTESFWMILIATAALLAAAAVYVIKNITENTYEIAGN